MRCLNCGSAEFSDGTCKRCGVTVATPAGAELLVASTGTRLVAFLIDGLIAVLLSLLLLVLAAMVGSSRDSFVALAAIYILGSLSYSLYVWYLLARRGQTVGKRAMGLRVVDADDATSIGWGRAFLRQLVLAVTGLIVVGYFSPLFDGSGRRRGWHDLVARSVVVDVRKGRDPLRVASIRATTMGAGPQEPKPTEPIPVTVGQASAPPSPWSSTPQTKQAALPHAVAARQSPAPALPELDSRVAVDRGPADPAIAGFPLAASNAPRQDRQEQPAPPGVITSVPGFEVPAPAPERDVPRDPDEAPPASYGVSAEGDGMTRAVRPNGPFISPMVLEFETGARHPVISSALIGRSPEAADGERFGELIAVVDRGMSMSKTHFAISVDPTGAWVVDRHSTNGTRVQRAHGAIEACVPGVPAGVDRGDVVLAGDHHISVK